MTTAEMQALAVLYEQMAYDDQPLIQSSTCTDPRCPSCAEGGQR